LRPPIVLLVDYVNHKIERPVIEESVIEESVIEESVIASARKSGA
jgi:hypothetical protein